MEKTDIITCLKKRKKTKRISKELIARLENSLHNDKMHYKIACAKIYFLLLLILNLAINF